MEKTAKRIGIALLAVLLVALLCAGIALALPQAETPLASADGSSSLDTSVRSVTVGDQVYDLTDWQRANAYYDYLVSPDQGYIPITDQTSLQKFLNENGGNSGAKGAMKPYDGSGNPISYTFGNTNGDSASPYNGANMGVNGIFQATLNGCGANVKVYVNQQWEGEYSTQHDSADAAKTHLLGSDSVTTILGGCGRSSLTGSLANTARNATVQNLNLTISDNATVLNGAKNRSGFIGGLFGAMYNTTIDNCSLNITSAITGTKVGVGDYEDVGYSVISIGGIAGYALNSTVSNFALTLTGSITANCEGDGYRSGFPRAAASGIVGIAQGVTMYNMVVTGAGGLTADLNANWDPGLAWDRKTHIARCGALIGITMSTGNAEAGTFGFNGHLGGTITVNGVLTDYSGPAGYQDITGNDEIWHSGKTGMLIGSCEAGAITNLYWNGDSVPSATSFAHNAGFTAIPVTTNVEESKGTAKISFKNETGAVSSLSGLQVTYTAPSDSGSILWSYTDDGAPGEGSDMYSTQPYETYTIQWPRGLSEARNVTFTTGRKVKYYVRYDGGDITGEGGIDADPVDTKPFDNTPYVHPVLQMWSPDGGTNLGEVNDNTYWSISKGETNSSWDTAVDVGTYNVRLIDAYKEDTAYDFIVEDQKLIAYKSDNSNNIGASRNYVFKITQRELTLDITEQPFVYDGEVQSLEFNLGKTVADDDPQPSVTAKYYNSAMTEIDVTQVVNAGDYFVTVTGVNDSNYYVNAEDLEEYTNWPFSIAKRTITLMPSGYQDLVYNGVPQYPEAEILGTDGLGGGVESIDIVSFSYYLRSNLDAPLEEPDRKDAGEYRMTALLRNPDNFVLDNSALESIPNTTVDETSVTIDYSIARDTLNFNGSADGGYSFVYMAQSARSLETLNKFIGGDANPTQYYFAPNNSANVTDVNVGATDAQFTVTGDGTSLLDVGTYQVVISMPQSKNFEEAQTTITVEITQRRLVLNFTADPERVISFQYGDVVPDYPRDNPQGAMAADQLKFGTVYYEGSISEENKQDVKPSDVGNYIASYEWIGTSSEYVSFEDIKGNYAVAEDANSTIAFTISKRDVTVTFANTDAVPYNGTEQNPVTITDIDGVIDSEVNKYTADNLKVQYISGGVASDTARNAGDYTLGAAATVDDQGAFVNNYNITNAPTFTVKEIELTVKVGEVAADYAAINSGSFVLTEGAYIVEQGTVYDTDIFDLVILGKVNGDQITQTDAVDSVGQYVYTLQLKEDGNALNYNLVSVLGTDGAAQVTTSNGGTLTVEGTEVRLILSVTAPDGSVSSLSVDEDGNFVVGSDNAYAYAAGDYTVTTMLIRTTSGYEGLAFNVPTIDVGTVSLDEQGMPKLVAKDADTYTFTISLTDDAATMYKFVGTNPSSITVTFVIDKRAVTVTPNTVDQTYGENFVPEGYTIEGDDGTVAAMLAADGFVPTITSTTNNTSSVDVYEDAIEMTYSFTTGSEGNYKITVNKGTATVVPRPVTVSLTHAENVTYGDGAPVITEVAAAEGSPYTILPGDNASLLEDLNTEGVLGLADRNVTGNRTKIVIADASAIANYAVTIADNTGYVTVIVRNISFDVADGVVPYRATEANITPANGVYYTNSPDFAYDDVDAQLKFTLRTDVNLDTQEPGNVVDALQLEFVDEALNANYNISINTAGDLTVQAMVIDNNNVTVVPDANTYTGETIGHTVRIGGIEVQANDRLTISITKDGSVVNEIKDAGDYVFTISGDGNYYQGSATYTVSIAKKDISKMDEIGLDRDSATYTGSKIEVDATTTIDVEITITNADGPAELINAGTYTVTVTATDPNYTGSKEFTFTVNKAPHKAPVESDLKIEVTWNSVTVTHDEFTVQLSKNGTDWDVDTTMGGYEANSDYMLYVRFKEDANHSASSNMIMISGTTLERTAVEFRITDVEEHYNRAVLTITFEEAFSGNVEYSLNGTTWNKLTVQDGKYVVSGLAESAEYTVQVKIPGGDDYLESEVKPVKVKTGIDPAKYTETLTLFGEIFSAGNLADYEKLAEQFNGLTEADKAGVDSAKFATITAAREAFVASVNSDIEDIQNVAAKTAGKAVAAAAAAVTAAAIALFIAKRKFI